MDPYGRWGCRDCSETYWSPASPVYVPERRVDGDEDRPLRALLQAHDPDDFSRRVELWLNGLHVAQAAPAKAPQAGTSRYWGVIAFCRTGRVQRPDKVAFRLVFALCVLLAVFFTVMLAAALTAEEPPSHRPTPVIRHDPSDLDKGRNPSSYEWGQAGPQGPPGPVPARSADELELGPNN